MSLFEEDILVEMEVAAVVVGLTFKLFFSNSWRRGKP